VSAIVDPRAFAVSEDFAPMSGIDEYMLHVGPMLRTALGRDPKAFERMWFSCVDSSGELLVVMGIGFYPNLDAADAFVIVNRRGVHTTVRAQRRLGHNRLDMRIGPINFELIAPFEQWRLSLGDNPFGITFELNWLQGAKLPVYHDAGEIILGDGRTYQPSLGYESFGCVEGWIDISGERIEVTADRFSGSRDHHWGTRENVGGPPEQPGPLAGHTHSGEFVEFKDFALFSKEIFYERGDPRQASPIVDFSRRLRFEPDTHLVVAGEVDLEFKNGETRHYTFERLGNQIAFLRCAMYGGFGGKGGTPDGDVWHGQYSGDEIRVSGEVYDVNDPAIRARLCGLDDSAARFECDGEVSYGIMESVHTFSWDAAQEDRGGFSVLT
jgi:hypothetical protein